LREDTVNQSNAGKYKSFKNLEVKREEIFKYINLVFKDLKNPNDQVLVQEFISKPKFSGVIFTRNINSNAPYYIINFDKSGYTDLITAGKVNPSMRTFVINRDKIKTVAFFGKKLISINKIEKFFTTID